MQVYCFTQLFFPLKVIAYGKHLLIDCANLKGKKKSSLILQHVSIKMMLKILINILIRYYYS